MPMTVGKKRQNRPIQHAGKLVLLKKHWKADPKADVVEIECPCCGVLTFFEDKTGTFDAWLTNEQSSIIISTECGHLERQEVHLDGYHEQRTSWGDLV